MSTDLSFSTVVTPGLMKESSINSFGFSKCPDDSSFIITLDTRSQRCINTYFPFSINDFPSRVKKFFFEIRRYFSKIAGNAADTAANLLGTTDAPLS